MTDRAPAPADVEAIAEVVTTALYNAETASGWYGQPECAEVGRVVAPALADLLARARGEAVAAVEGLFNDLADELDAIDGDAWVSLGGVSLGGAVRHTLTEANALWDRADRQEPTP